MGLRGLGAGVGPEVKEQGWARGSESAVRSSVVCGSGPSGSRPHNRRRVQHRGTEQPRLGRTAAVE